MGEVKKRSRLTPPSRLSSWVSAGATHWERIQEAGQTQEGGRPSVRCEGWGRWQAGILKYRSGTQKKIWTEDRSWRLILFYSISFYFFSTYYVPGIDLGTRNSVVNETKPLSAWNLHCSVWGEERQSISTHIDCKQLVLSGKGNREYRMGYYFK